MKEMRKSRAISYRLPKRYLRRRSILNSRLNRKLTTSLLNKISALESVLTHLIAQNVKVIKLLKNNIRRTRRIYCRPVFPTQYNQGEVPKMVTTHLQPKVASAAVPKVLFLGDCHVRDFAQIFNEMVAGKMDGTGECKPSANMEIVLECSEIYKLTSKDFLIVMAGTNNAMERKMIADSSVKVLLEAATRTNLILCTVPEWKGNKDHNILVQQVNDFLYASLEPINTNINIVDLKNLLTDDMFGDSGVHINPYGKKQLVLYIKNRIDQISAGTTYF